MSAARPSGPALAALFAGILLVLLSRGFDGALAGALGGAGVALICVTVYRLAAHRRSGADRDWLPSRDGND